jgi:hypothetical protein
MINDVFLMIHAIYGLLLATPLSYIFKQLELEIYPTNSDILYGQLIGPFNLGKF